MEKYICLISLILAFSSCQSQTERNNKIVGGPCEGCEAIYEFGDKNLTSSDTLPDFEENDPKISITGIVYANDRKTPAKNIILYIYQTNRNGIYEKKGDEKGWARRHGHIRGWIKTDADGKYKFFTFRPGAYPGGLEPEHIHITVKEPDKNEYYIDDFLFTDDPLLTEEKRNTLKLRGGSGIINLNLENGVFTAKRDIILGLNIPNY